MRDYSQYEKGRGTFMRIDGKRVDVSLWLAPPSAEPLNNGSFYFGSLEWRDVDGRWHEAATLGAEPRGGDGSRCIAWVRKQLKRMWVRMAAEGRTPCRARIFRDNCAGGMGGLLG